MRRMRDRRGWTQAQLAAKCEVYGVMLSRGTLAKIESRIRGASDMELYVLAKVFRVSFEALFPSNAGEEIRKCVSKSR